MVKLPGKFSHVAARKRMLHAAHGIAQGFDAASDELVGDGPGRKGQQVGDDEIGPARPEREVHVANVAELQNIEVGAVA
jgi:hypothetical protein